MMSQNDTVSSKTKVKEKLVASTSLEKEEFKQSLVRFSQKKGVFNSDHSSYYCKVKHILPYSSL